jgi:hypothetical protein
MDRQAYRGSQGSPGEGRGLLVRRERGLAGFDPFAPVGDRGQLAAAHAAEEAAIWGSDEAFQARTRRVGSDTDQAG